MKYFTICLFILSISWVGCHHDSSSLTSKKQVEVENKKIVKEEQLLKGKAIYEGCSVCHKLKDDGPIAPGLCGIEDRQPRAQIAKWIKNSQKLIREEKDPYAIALYKKYKYNEMTSFSLSEEELDCLLLYLRVDCN